MARPIVNGHAQVVVGDTTTHGGKVVSGSPLTVWGPAKKPIARVDDMVTCPKCKPHLFPIVEGESFFTDSHMAVALHGHKVACGALLIAQARPIDFQFDPTDVTYNDRYIIRDENGVGIPNVYYGVRFPNGVVSFFTAGEQGETEFFDTEDQVKDLEFFIAG